MKKKTVTRQVKTLICKKCEAQYLDGWIYPACPVCLYKMTEAEKLECRKKLAKRYNKKNKTKWEAL